MRVKLKIDGEEVPLNPFVTKIFGNLLQAMVASLHGINEAWRGAVLEVERD